MKYHVPVLLRETIEALNIKPNGIYVDLTFGGGGHSEVILQHLNNDGHLYAFDCDEDALEQTPKLSNDNFTLIYSNYIFIRQFMKYYNVSHIDGALLDLGVSSHQIDTPERGFSTRYDGDLDMRMNKNTTLTASTVINTYPIDNLTKLFKEYGEVKNAHKLAEIIRKYRRERRINTTQELVNIIENGECVNEKYRNQYLSQVFQALRIEVNSELANLKTVLSYIPDLLSDDGRLVVLSYHSLEDTIVKSFVKTGNFDGKLIKDYFGNIIRPLDPINNKPIMATHEECVINNRARSAKMRVAQKKLC